MNRLIRTFAACVALLAGSVIVFVGGGAADAVPSVPWSDPNTIGYIGFCNAQNQQITSGSIDSFPFAVKAVSSTPPPTGYGHPNGRATLYAFQPIEYVTPDSWSGKQMTGASLFSSDRAPMAAGLPSDPSLLNFVQAYPLHWEGFAQFRIYYTAINGPQFSTTYPAAAIYVHGSTWTQVGGGRVACGSGVVRSDEGFLPRANDQLHQGGAAKASGNAVQKGSATPAPTTGSTGAGSAGSSGASKGGASSSGGTSSPAALTSGKGSSHSTAVVLWLIVAALVLVGLGFAVRLRRRGGNSVPPPDAA